MKTKYKCVVISDTHGDMRPILEVIEKEKPFDILMHCGDVEGNLDSILGTQPFGYFSVRGNCDVFSDAPQEHSCKLGYFRVFVTHGHRYNVRYQDIPLVEAGRRELADVILYGHTHVPDVHRDERSGILVVNPGSLSRPRQVPRVPTYAVLMISDEELPRAEICTLDGSKQR